MIRAALTAKPDANGAQVFFGVALTFMFGAVAWVIFPLAGALVWAFGIRTIIRRVLYNRQVRAAAAQREQQRASWDAQWSRWGGRLPFDPS